MPTKLQDAILAALPIALIFFSGLFVAFDQIAKTASTAVTSSALGTVSGSAEAARFVMRTTVSESIPMVSRVYVLFPLHKV